MNELIKAIEDMMILIPKKWNQYPTETAVPYAYISGVIEGRQQAIEMIKEFLDIKKEPPSPKG